MDLDNIQAKLKIAIQNHQVVVAKMKQGTLDPSLQQKLHELQEEIMNLSEKQKQVVQELRKEFALQGLIKNENADNNNKLPSPQSHRKIAPMPSPQPLSVSTTINATHGSSMIRVPQYSPVPRPLTLMLQKSANSPHSYSHTSPSGKQKLSRQPSPQIQQHFQSSSVQSPAEDAPVNIEGINVGLDQKDQFLANLGLVTRTVLEELQTKRQERKRRTTANPAYSWVEPDRKVVKNYLSTSTSPLSSAFKRPRGRPPKTGNGSPSDSRSSTPDSGEVTINGVTNGSYVTDKMAYSRPNQPWNGTLAIVHSFVAHKAAREDEKKKLSKKSQDLKLEQSTLEARAKYLTSHISSTLAKKTELTMQNKAMEETLEQLKNFVKVFETKPPS